MTKAYEDTLKDIEETFGAVPGFMKFFSQEKLIREWPSWKNIGEIDLERASYLISTDESLEEMLDEAQVEITDRDKIIDNMEFSSKDKIVYGELVGIDKTELVGIEKTTIAGTGELQS